MLRDKIDTIVAGKDVVNALVDILPRCQRAHRRSLA
jgi:hypothetical protein